MKNNKGITLVALVVTIVVLLILARVSINLVLGDNGIVKKAQDAKTKSAEASENDLKGMNSLVSEMEGALAGNGGAGGSGTDTKVPAEATAETAPYFPDNTFTKKEGTIDKGLVIQDASGNEYVWVVVPRTTAVYATTGLGKTKFTDADYISIETDLKNYTSTYRNGRSYSDTWAEDTDNVGWLTSDEYTELKNNMLKSVYLNGGFYVGRYEAGIGTNRTSEPTRNSNGKYDIEELPTPITKADVYPYTYVTRTQAQNLAKSLSNGKSYTSSLMFGVQWDLVLAFMAKDKTKITSTTVLTSNSTSIGNYRDSAFKLNTNSKYVVFSHYSFSSRWNPSTTATENFVDSSSNKISQTSNGNGILVTTGTSEQNKVMNIYDIAGNVGEFTLVNTSDINFLCAYGGGHLAYTGSGYPASNHNVYSTATSSFANGFRVSLF